MYLYLIQHGNAIPKETDPVCPLSEAGQRAVSVVANFMKKTGVEVAEIWHSSKLRAKQTAEILAKELSVKSSIEKKWLAPNDPIFRVVDEINLLTDNTIIVSHLPFLSKLSSSLLSGCESNEIIRFSQGGVVCLEKTNSHWSAAWMITPKLALPDFRTGLKIS